MTIINTNEALYQKMVDKPYTARSESSQRFLTF